MDRKPIIVAPYDAELFGHWWYEGPLWLNHLLRKIAAVQRPIQLVTLSEYLQLYPDIQPASPPMSSWGRNGFNQVWLNPENQWIYPRLQQAARVLDKLEADYLCSDRLTMRALDQARRELLLAQSSDWAFMMSSRTTTEYAAGRTNAHLLNFTRLSDQIAGKNIDDKWLAEIEARDCIFSARVLRTKVQVGAPPGRESGTIPGASR